MRGLGKDRFTLLEQADKTFEGATATITPAARSLIAQLQSVDNPPDEVALIASVAAEANFMIPMTWRHRGAASG